METHLQYISSSLTGINNFGSQHKEVKVRALWMFQILKINLA